MRVRFHRFLLVLALCPVLGASGAPRSDRDKAVLGQLPDAPLLFVKRLNYLGIHIYDTYYKWRPGGGIYILENPADPPAQHRIRPLIDATTPETLGEGVYSDPDLSWDATRVVFCFKGEKSGNTSIYEIGIDGTALRRLSDPSPCAAAYKGGKSGQHDVTPAYLPDGRFVLTSTRPSGLVPCANSGVSIMHVMNGDGTDLHPISVNTVDEFDPCVLPDGRLLFGRWEYVDKNALTQQSLWTVFPDGTNETALYANNMAQPEALLDARPVPGHPHLIAAALTRHNAPPRGSIAMVDTRVGKNDVAAITNFERPNDPAYDRGESCEPWPLSPDLVLCSARMPGSKRNSILLMGRDGHRVDVVSDPKLDCHSPIPIQPRACPPVATDSVDRAARVGAFFVQDIHEGLDGVPPGTVKWLRVVEETSRVSATPGGAFNQTFLVSGILAFSVKNFLGIVPVAPDGSAYFEAPSGRALYFQALDAEGRLVRSMRTFVQAAPGAVRSCIGCHERKFASPGARNTRRPVAVRPRKLAPESWGSGYVDYPSMVQPVFDRHCVRCHGGSAGIAGGLDLTGGWTEHFSISYENLVSRRKTQVTADLIAGIDCMNGTALWSARIFPPLSHGSGAAPLAEVLVSGHDGRINDLTRAERDLVLAWIDSNGLYHGSWDYSKHGCRIGTWGQTKAALVRSMKDAGCMKCHGDAKGKAVLFESDWVNLRTPERSRLLRAPLPAGAPGLGLGFCRQAVVDPSRRRLRLLATGKYAHGIKAVEAFRVPPRPAAPVGDAVVSFRSTSDSHYQAMLEIIRGGRRKALTQPRVDMPGAVVIAGACRQFVPPCVPEPLPELRGAADADGVVHLSWERSARTIGLEAALHRGDKPGFAPTPETLLAQTTLFAATDAEAAPGQQHHYALVLFGADGESSPVRACVHIPSVPPPPLVSGLRAAAGPGRVDLRWDGLPGVMTKYRVYRADGRGAASEQLTVAPTASLTFTDVPPADGRARFYTVRAVNRRGTEGAACAAVAAAALAEPQEPVFLASFCESLDATLADGMALAGKRIGNARVVGGTLDLERGGHVTFPHRPAFDVTHRLTIACWLKVTKPAQMPVVLGCGQWAGAGWFLQRIGTGWRWYVGGVHCDGGQPAPGQWTHLAATYDGDVLRLFQDGVQVAEKPGTINADVWPGLLHVGQYSGGPGRQYQVTGRLADVRIYARALGAADIGGLFRALPGVLKAAQTERTVE